MSREKDPQRKKKDSYERDRRNCYGESDKGSRKSIRRNKALSHRRVRHVAKQKDFEDDAAESEVKAVELKSFKKCPDMPLGEMIQVQKGKRANRVGSHKKRISI